MCKDEGRRGEGRGRGVGETLLSSLDALGPYRAACNSAKDLARAH